MRILEHVGPVLRGLGARGRALRRPQHCMQFAYVPRKKTEVATQGAHAKLCKVVETSMICLMGQFKNQNSSVTCACELLHCSRQQMRMRSRQQWRAAETGPGGHGRGRVWRGSVRGGRAKTVDCGGESVGQAFDLWQVPMTCLCRVLINIMFVCYRQILEPCLGKVVRCGGPISPTQRSTQRSVVCIPNRSTFRAFPSLCVSLCLLARLYTAIHRPPAQTHLHVSQAP